MKEERGKGEDELVITIFFPLQVAFVFHQDYPPTSRNEASEEDGETVMTVTAEGENDTDEKQYKSCDNAFPCQVG